MCTIQKIHESSLLKFMLMLKVLKGVNLQSLIDGKNYRYKLMLKVLKGVNLQSLIDGKNYRYKINDIIEDAEVFKQHLGENNYNYFLAHKYIAEYTQDTTQDEDVRNYKFTQEYKTYKIGDKITSQDFTSKQIQKLLDKEILIELKVF